MLETILAVLVTLASIALILVVLFQSGKKSGLSGAIGGGAAETFLSKSKNGDLDQMLATSTKWIALAWIVLILLMSLV